MSRVEKSYDDQVAVEWAREQRHRTEFAVTRRVLAAHLPPPPAAIADIGGGPGRYAIALAGQGYDVTLVDLAANNLAWAEGKAAEAGVTLAHVLHADARDLRALAAGNFDAVLLLGPLYHLHRREDRLQAVAEARRLLRPGGVLFAAFITLFAGFRDSAAHFPEWPVENRAYAERVLRTGIHDDPDSHFPDAYFVHPRDVIPFMEEAGLETLGLYGVEGVAAGHEEQLNELEGEAWEVWVDLNFRLGQDPSLHGASDHLVYVGRSGSRLVE